jgi:hypothetical protein
MFDVSASFLVDISLLDCILRHSVSLGPYDLYALIYIDCNEMGLE